MSAARRVRLRSEMFDVRHPCAPLTHKADTCRAELLCALWVMNSSFLWPTSEQNMSFFISESHLRPGYTCLTPATDTLTRRLILPVYITLQNSRSKTPNRSPVTAHRRSSHSLISTADVPMSRAGHLQWSQRGKRKINIVLV